MKRNFYEFIFCEWYKKRNLSQSFLLLGFFVLCDDETRFHNSIGA